MNTSSLLEIFCDGNEKIGYGHIRRSTALAKHLRKEKMDVRLSGLSESAKKMLPDSENTAQKANFVLFDSLEGIDSQIEEAQKKNQVTITLDWFGNTLSDINIVVYPHKEVKAKREKFIGFEYIILREEILALTPTKKTESANKVLVCIGGGDLLNQGHEAATHLSNLGCDVTLVQGPLAKNKTKSDTFRLLINPPDFAQHLINCDWAVTNGGGCFFEALYLGKAAFILPQTEYEMNVANFSNEKAAVLGIGINNLKTFTAEELNMVSENGSKLIDGKGLNRIESILKTLA